ncbi:MAG: twin-arginine translocase subunit TatC [Kiritimatiellae bacterium]|jgi:sec-independent protein translocase protein TatC|nr:twin-arginine translocase subunit TatC [Kiritimatiellia bacterium]
MKIGRFGKDPESSEESEKDYNDPPRPFIEHLIELRTCVIRSFLAWFCCLLVIAPFSPMITDWLISPANQSMDKVQGLTWTTGLDILLKIMLWGGTALSLPLLFFFIMRFVFPGLKKSERTIIVFCLGGSTVLFLGGVWMAYAKTLEIAFQVLQKINGWMGVKVDILKIEDHISIVLKTIIAFGVAFQVPLVILVLGWIGIVSSDWLRKKRRIAIVLTFAMAMMLTPPDPVSQIIMAVPMCVLYEVCILAIRLRELTKKKKRDGKYDDKNED